MIEIIGIFRKGFFSIITAFLVVIVIVFSLLVFIGFSGLVIQTNKGVSTNVDYMVNANLFKDRLLLCHGKTTLIEEKLDNGECSDLIEGINGYRVVQQQALGCNEKVWDFGKIDETSGRYVYWVPVQQIYAKKCLAKLFVYY